MAVIKPFSCVRPAEAYADKIAALPYDVYNREEATEKVKGDQYSFLRIDRAETQFSSEVDTYAPEVYAKAKELLAYDMERGIYVTDEDKKYYIYELTMNGRVQTGIVAVASIDDYMNAVIKKHENTRADKELDRITHVDCLSAQTGPIFLAYRAQDAIRQVVKDVKEEKALYDFVSDDGIRHRVFEIGDASRIQTIEYAFSNMNEIYIADGHHRAASAVKVGLKRRAEHPDYDGTEEFNYFLSVLFPDEELMIMDYNRVVKDLNGYTTEEFLAEVKKLFQVTELEEKAGPQEKGSFTMYLDGKWYLCKMTREQMVDHPVDGLDVSVLQNTLLGPVLDIDDPKTNKRIDFVGGIRGLEELERRCSVEGDSKVAFAMFATSIQELFEVADAKLLMPPKSTWFEPKLRSGLFIHQIER